MKSTKQKTALALAVGAAGMLLLASGCGNNADNANKDAAPPVPAGAVAGTPATNKKQNGTAPASAGASEGSGTLMPAPK